MTEIWKRTCDAPFVSARQSFRTGFRQDSGGLRREVVLGRTPPTYHSPQDHRRRRARAPAAAGRAGTGSVHRRPAVRRRRHHRPPPGAAVDGCSNHELTAPEIQATGVRPPSRQTIRMVRPGIPVSVICGSIPGARSCRAAITALGAASYQ